MVHPCVLQDIAQKACGTFHDLPETRGENIILDTYFSLILQNAVIVCIEKDFKHASQTNEPKYGRTDDQNSERVAKRATEWYHRHPIARAFLQSWQTFLHGQTFSFIHLNTHDLLKSEFNNLYEIKARASSIVTRSIDCIKRQKVWQRTQNSRQWPTRFWLSFVEFCWNNILFLVLKGCTPFISFLPWFPFIPQKAVLGMIAQTT